MFDLAATLLRVVIISSLLLSRWLGDSGASSLRWPRPMLSFGQQCLAASSTFIGKPLSAEGYTVRQEGGDYALERAVCAQPQGEAPKSSPDISSGSGAPEPVPSSRPRAKGPDKGATAESTFLKAVKVLHELRRGQMAKAWRSAQRSRRETILRKLEREGVSHLLASRISFQMVARFGPRYTSGTICTILGQLLAHEARRLKGSLKLSDRKIAFGLTKLSAHEVSELFRNLGALDATFGRLMAGATLQAVDPLESERRFVEHYPETVAYLTSNAIDPLIARAFAIRVAARPKPLVAAERLVQNFHMVMRFAQESHPEIARAVALAACSYKDPSARAKSYLNNYDKVVVLLGKTQLNLAQAVADLTSRGYDPLASMPWCLKLLKTSIRRSRRQAILFGAA